jgi:hypothetical protein
MLRRLQPIEIAEGALLADIAVVIQFLTIYLPLPRGVGLLRILILVVFAVVVLRRGLYVGIMAMCVALFVVAIILGPLFTISMSIGAAAGLFLGFTMKHRLPHALLLLLGVTFGSLTIYGLTFIGLLVAGTSLADFVQFLRQAYEGVIAFVDVLAIRVGLSGLWKQVLLPQVTQLAEWGFTNWWLAYYLALWFGMAAPVTAIYTGTNFLVRLLGYDVRPFPDGKLNKLLQWLRRQLIRVAVKRRLIKKQGANV